MEKIICGKLYNTTTSEIVKKVTEGVFGDPKGYEETLYVTSEGFYFLYTNGGSESKYTEEKITRMSKKNAEIWLSEN